MVGSRGKGWMDGGSCYLGKCISESSSYSIFDCCLRDGFDDNDHCIQYLFLPPNCWSSLFPPPLGLREPIPPAIPDVEYLGMFEKL